MTVERVAGECHPFDHHVRIALHQNAVLESTRLAFVSIAQQVRWLAGVSRHETPLHSGRESSAAAAPQPACLDLFDDRSLIHRKRLLERPVAASLAILCDARLLRLVVI